MPTPTLTPTLLPEFSKMRVYRKLQNWCREGRSMPGYSFGYGGPYIGYLLGLISGPIDSPREYLDLEDEITKTHPRIWEMLEGPNGWTILQMLIARKAETLANKENSHG